MVHADEHRLGQRSVPDKDIERAIAVIENQIVRATDKHDEPSVGADARIVAIGHGTFEADRGNSDRLGCLANVGEGGEGEALQQQ